MMWTDALHPASESHLKLKHARGSGVIPPKIRGVQK
jgi:hypothetical protein